MSGNIQFLPASLMLDAWGREFALHRDCEYLGHQSKNLLHVLIEHKGELPGRAQGYKPLEISPVAEQIELIVTRLARGNRPAACCLRAYYCGSGRRKVERHETANLLLATAGERVVRCRTYLVLVDMAEAYVRGALDGMSEAA